MTMPRRFGFLPVACLGCTLLFGAVVTQAQVAKQSNDVLSSLAIHS